MQVLAIHVQVLLNVQVVNKLMFFQDTGDPQIIQSKFMNAWNKVHV